VASVAFAPDGKMLATGGSDTTVLVWDVQALRAQHRQRRTDPRPEVLEKLWADLARPEADQAQAALWQLAAAPAKAVPLVKARVKAVPPVKAGLLERLVAELGHERYAVRQKATRELEALGEVADAALRGALDANLPLEVRRRVEQLLDKVDGPVTLPDQLRALRAVELLERVGDSEARQVLETLAGGEPGARLTRDARAALARLAVRSAASPPAGRKP
jgi:hypothetical protein